MRRTGRKTWGKAAWAVLGVFAVIGVGGFGAWRYLSHRAGEAAVQLIPADAHMVLTFDTAPGDADQAALFKQIGDALEREGLLAKIDEFADSGMQAPVLRDVRPYCTKSCAAALWMKDPDSKLEPDFAVLTAVTDPEAVEKVLAKYGAAEGDAYAIKEPRTYAAVAGEYLVFGNKAELVQRVKNTSPGDSVAGLPAYLAARAGLPTDANVMCFLSPEFMQFSRKATGNKNLAVGVDWCAYSTSLRKEGLVYDFQVPADADSASGLSTLAKTVPLDSNLLAGLPAGAYGLIAVSQPSAYWSLIDEALRSDAKESDQIKKGIEMFERETGLNIQRDVLPAFKGDLAVAVYPAGDSVDVVVEFSDRNGADPAGLAEKVRLLVEKKSAGPNGQGVKLVSSRRGQATVWSLDEKVRKGLVAGMAGGGAQPESPYATASQPPASPRPAPGGMSEAVKDKTVTYAVVGKSVILTSSTRALDAALATRLGRGGSLQTDGAWVKMEASVDAESQYIMMVDIGRIMKAVKPSLEKSLSDGPVSADEVASIFGDGKTGFTSCAKYNGKVVSGRAVLPLDYDKLITVVAKLLKHIQPPKP